MVQEFVRGMSDESRYFRFASTMPEMPARMLARYYMAKMCPVTGWSSAATRTASFW